ncbi:ComEC/Rec2 family competence protein [Pseudomonas wadenswilerensis]
MSSHFRLYSLDVGQGMSTLFAVYDTAGNITALALFDLGSLGKRDVAGPSTLEFLKKMALLRESPNGRIDAVFISHKDGDHINLFFGSESGKDPLEGLLRLLPDMTIGVCRYGGRYSWYAGTATVDKKSQNLLTLIKARTADPDNDVKGFPVGASSVLVEGGVGPLWGGADYVVFLVAANAPYNGEAIGTAEDKISDKPNGDQANSKSLVLVVGVEAGGTMYKAIIGGDATFPTFQYINYLVEGTGKDVYMTLLPHHGSRKTTFGLPSKSKPISDEARGVVETYARLMSGKTVVASADTGSNYGHPSMETSQLFLQYADTSKTWWTDPLVGNGRHFTTAYIDYALNPGTYNYTGMKTVLTTQNLYSTRYYDGAVLSSPMVAYAPFVAFDTLPYNSNFAFAPGMNWIYTLLPQAMGFLIDFRGVSSNRLPKDQSLEVLSADRLLESFSFVHREGLPEVEPPVQAVAPLPSPRVQPRPVIPGKARAPAQAQRLAPRLGTPGASRGGRR